MKRKSLILLTGILVILLISTTNSFSYENMFHKNSSTKINYDSLYNAAIPLGESEVGRGIVENWINSYGGREKLKKLDSYSVTYRMKTLHSADSSDVTKLWKAGRQYKITRSDSKNAESRILNHQQSWFQNMDTTITLNSGRYKAELFSYLTMSMPLAIETERFDGIRYGMRENETLHFIYMKKNDSLMITIGIDPHKFHIVSSEGVIYQEDQKFIFINIFSDYGDVDGYLFAHRLKNISMGLEVGNSILTSCKVDIELDNNEFKPGSLPKPSSKLR